MNTDGLRDMATRLRSVANEVELTAAQQARDAHNAHWVSTSGDVFRESSLELRGALVDGAAHLVDTAARLDAVANTVDERVAAIAAAAAAAAAAAQDLADDVVDGAQAFAEDVADGAEVIADAAGDVADTAGQLFTGATDLVGTAFRRLP